jgi:putative hemolysin
LGVVCRRRETGSVSIVIRDVKVLRGAAADRGCGLVRGLALRLAALFKNWASKLVGELARRCRQRLQAVGSARRLLWKGGGFQLADLLEKETTDRKWKMTAR